MSSDWIGDREAVFVISDSYDEQTIEVMKLSLKPESSCIDIGAHYGIVLQQILKIAPLGTHWAFEPLPDAANHLRESFPAVKLFEAAASDYAGTSNFVHVENDACYSGLKERIYDRPDVVLRSITVNVLRLDDVIPVEQAITFIKIDIEGGEFHAIRGAERIILHSRPIIVFEAGVKSTGQYGVDPEDFFSLLADHLGYEISTMKRWLNRGVALTRHEFGENWHHGPDFYFIAYPK